MVRVPHQPTCSTRPAAYDPTQRNTLAEEGNVSMTKSKDWAKEKQQEISDEDYQDLVDTASTSINTDE